jgi:hypothetical protein
VIIFPYRTILFFLTFLASSTLAFSADLLPYTQRTHPYSGWSTPAQGDIRTVGMSGATLGLADTFIAALDNPAGLAMTLSGADSNFASTTIHDGNVQNFQSTMTGSNFGVALNTYPWGFSLGYNARTHEGQEYVLSTVPNDVAYLSTATREFSISVARVLLKNRLSLGWSMILGQAENQMEFLKNTAPNTAYHSYALASNFGALYRFPHRFLLGISYRLPMHYTVNQAASPSEIPGFFQPIDVPWRLGLGLGWIPNRFFRADLSVFAIGPTAGTALLRDDTTLVGQQTTFQPKIGGAYNFIDFKELKATAFLGLYYETSRIDNETGRSHITSGIEIKPWILSLGAGSDFAKNYKNLILSLGVDIFKVMEKLDIIPTMPHSPYAGALPGPDAYSTTGLPSTLIRNEKPPQGQQGPNPIQIGLDIPKKIKQKAKQIKNDVVDAFSVEDQKTNTKKRIKVK